MLGHHQDFDGFTSHLSQDRLFQFLKGERMGDKRLELNATAVDQRDSPAVGIRVNHGAYGKRPEQSGQSTV